MTAKKTTKPATKKTTNKAKPKKATANLKELGGQYASPKTDGKEFSDEEIESAKKPTLASSVRAKKTDEAEHVIIEARAGTGKTTTLVEGLKRVKGIASTLVPSPQQEIVWNALEKSRGIANTICFVAFNKSIATELQARVPVGCDAMTMHSMGMKAVNKAFDRPRVNNYRVQDIISAVTGRDIRELRKYKPTLLSATEALVGLVKQNLIGIPGVHDPLSVYGGGITEEALVALAGHYDVETNGDWREIVTLVPKVIERCMDVSTDRQIDFDDMIWLPVALNLPVFQYDLLLVDEAQDLNRCQQQLAIKASKRLVLCGDPKQAIYGFAGADSESLKRMETILGATERGVVTLPLTVTRRCGKAVVAEAQKIVPDFEAFADNGAGKVSSASYPRGENKKDEYSTFVSDGDMVICRVNAPLVSQCFRFLKAGRKAYIQGRDIGQGLIKTVKKLSGDKNYEALADDPQSLPNLVANLSDWLAAEVAEENAKRIPNENKVINLQDRHDCLVAFTEGLRTVREVVAKIETIFTDDKSVKGIRLSSIHKAKGLEAPRVFFLVPKEAPCPHPMAKSAWQKEQELNLKYVGITRAIEELVWVS